MSATIENSKQLCPNLKLLPCQSKLIEKMFENKGVVHLDHSFINVFGSPLMSLLMFYKGGK